MRRAFGYTLAWCGATALAVGVSWLGVRDVLRSAVLDEAPLAPVVAVAGPAGLGSHSPGTVPQGTASQGTASQGTASPGAASPGAGAGASPGTPAPVTTADLPSAAPLPTTVSPRKPSRVPPTSPPRPSSTARPGSTTKPTAKARPAPSATGESLHTFTLKGGRATVAVTATDCRVVTATPADGYEVKVWETASWLRVAFLQGAHESSAFCTWNTLPPRLDTYET